jgi:RNA polymerase sigma factor (sigma-70 family)
LFRKYSDTTIIEGIRNQDDAILKWLYSNYLQTVRKHVLSNSGSEEDVNDVFQDSIIVLYNQVTHENIKLTADLKGYFFGIARNVWNSHLRKRQKLTDLDVDPVDDPFQDQNDDAALENIVARCFKKLKPDQQMVLNLFMNGHSYEEIALRMGLKNEEYARRKKYLSKEALLELIKKDPEYHEYLDLRK